MKKFIALMLALTLLPLAVSCGTKDDGEILGSIDDFFDRDKINDHIIDAHAGEQQLPANMDKVYSNLTTALLALEKGEITKLSLSRSAAEYIVAHNEKFDIFKSEESIQQTEAYTFSMLTLDTNTELNGILDSAIKQLKADGTLDRLIAEDIVAHIESDPTPSELPTFDGAKTYKIAVTGDLPPMDYVTADGKAAGFNVSLLSEIAEIAKVNFELVHIDTGARLTALAAETVDAVFWNISYACHVCGDYFITAPKGTLVTESYYDDFFATVLLK